MGRRAVSGDRRDRGRLRTGAAPVRHPRRRCRSSRPRLPRPRRKAFATSRTRSSPSTSRRTPSTCRWRSPSRTRSRHALSGGFHPQFGLSRKVGLPSLSGDELPSPRETRARRSVSVPRTHRHGCVKFVGVDLKPALYYPQSQHIEFDYDLPAQPPRSGERHSHQRRVLVVPRLRVRRSRPHKRADQRAVVAHPAPRSWGVDMKREVHVRSGRLHRRCDRRSGHVDRVGRRPQ